MKTTWNASWEMTYSFSQTDEFSWLTIFIQWGPFPSQQLAVLFGPLNTERRKISTRYFLSHKVLHCINVSNSAKSHECTYIENLFTVTAQPHLPIYLHHLYSTSVIRMATQQCQTQQDTHGLYRNVAVCSWCHQ